MSENVEDICSLSELQKNKTKTKEQNTDRDEGPGYYTHYNIFVPFISFSV